MTRRNAAVGLSILLLIVTEPSVASPLAQGSTRSVEDRLKPEDLESLTGTNPSERREYLRSLGVAEDWRSQFEGAALAYAATAPEDRRRDPDRFVSIADGLVLVDLLGDKSVAPILKRLVAAPGCDESLAYMALIALSNFGTEDDFLVAQIRGRDRSIAKLAMIATALRSDPLFLNLFDKLEQDEGRDRATMEALEFIKFCEHETQRYKTTESFSERLAFVERHLRRAYDMIGEIRERWVLSGGGHPISHWAVERWRELSNENPAEMKGYIQGLQEFQTREPSAGYRRFLARHTIPSVRTEILSQPVR